MTHPCWFQKKAIHSLNGHLRCMFINHNEIMNRLMSLMRHINISNRPSRYMTSQCHARNKKNQWTLEGLSSQQLPHQFHPCRSAILEWKLFSFMNRVVDISLLLMLLSDMISNDNKAILSLLLPVTIYLIKV